MADSAGNIFAVLLAGGTGTRLWPVSRELYPKQLVKFIGNDSLVQSTIKRLSPLLDLENVRVVCGEQHYHEISRHIKDIGISSQGKVIQEPSGRNTAPAILLAAFYLRHALPDGIMCVFPADHVIGNVAAFHERLGAAIALAGRDYIVTFGIKANYPETGYGYIEAGAAVSEGALRVERFVEKPDRPTAERYLDAGNFFWNSGMFAFKVAVILEEFKKHQPQMLAVMEELFATEREVAKQDYDRLDNISIDYAIMEKTDKCIVVPSDFAWSDIGSWKSLYDFLEKDENNNVLDGDIIVRNTHNCFVLGHDRLIAANRLHDLVVVETPDSIFVSDMDNSRDVKSIVSELKSWGRKESQQHRTIYHPWGIAKLLEQTDDYKAFDLTVYPNTRFRLPEEDAGTRYFIVIKGNAEISTASRRQALETAGFFTSAAAEAVSIENSGSEEVCLVQIIMRSRGV